MWNNVTTLKSVLEVTEQWAVGLSEYRTVRVSYAVLSFTVIELRKR